MPAGCAGYPRACCCSWLAHGAAAPFTLRALSERFDSVDGPLEPDGYIELATDVIMTALLAPGGAPPKNRRGNGRM
jgi:hypothetical protein